MNSLLAKVGALITFLLGFFLIARKSGKDAIRAETNQKALDDVRTANAIDAKILPITDDDLNRELRKHAKH